MTATGSFTDEERAAMKERASELKAAGRRTSKGAAASGESDLQAKIDAMTEPDRPMARRLHELIIAAVPGLTQRTWYGMPAYAKDGSIICFFQPAQKFKTRYATLGFSDKAKLDEGAMWPVYYALAELTPAAEEQITGLIRTAAS